MRAMKANPPVPLALACAALLGSGIATAAPSSAELLNRLEQMNARLEKLERRNAELERQLATPALAPQVEKRLQSLEENRNAIARGLESERISEYEPELSARLKAVENDALNARKTVKKIEALDGLKAGVSLTSVAQRVRGLPNGTTDGGSQLGYRADVTVELPLKPFGDIEHKLFGHFRIGQGEGVNKPLGALGTFAGAANAIAFRTSGAPADDSTAVLGEAWYQASIPLPFGGFKPHAHEKIELTFGKMDLFSFFDQNALAGDESRQFLNSVFVHNPLLDAGGQAGVDANGFQPGAIVSYRNERSRTQSWRLSLGLFGSGERGANYQRSLAGPLVIAQAESTTTLFGQLPGNYRAYAWKRSQAPELDSTTNRQTGWGLSLDQQVGGGLALFARYGSMMQGKTAFDRALTLGGELNGNHWGRAADAIGFSTGWLHASRDYTAGAVNVDLNGDGIADYAFLPGGAERIAELYYRYRINANVDLTPDFQYIGRSAANPDARSLRIFGLRAQFAF